MVTELHDLEDQLEKRVLETVEKGGTDDRESLIQAIRAFLDTMRQSSHERTDLADLEWRQRALYRWRDFLRADELRATSLADKKTSGKQAADAPRRSQEPRWLEAVKQVSERQLNIGSGYVGLANQAADLARREARSWIDLYLDELRWYVYHLRR